MRYALTTLLFAAVALGDCGADNCLRAFRATQTPGRLVAAQSFCSSFTATSVAVTAIPTFAVNACPSNKAGDLSERISSACSCIATGTIATSVPLTTTSSSTSKSATSSSVATTSKTSLIVTTTSSTSTTTSTTTTTSTSTSSSFTTSTSKTSSSITSTTSSSTTSKTSSSISSTTSSSSSSTISSSVSTTSGSTSTVANACSTVSSLSASFVKASPGYSPTVAASIAQACLESVPLHSDAAIAYVDGLKPYLEWQSDSAFKKNPPADYFYPALDIFGKLASIRANLVNKLYSNEFSFQKDLYQVFAPGHDGHYIVYPDLLSKAFQFGRPLRVVSISKDGTSIPEIYIYEDIINAPTTASVVKLINGIDASTFIANEAYTASLNQDADAAYNSMFYEEAYLAAGVSYGYFAGYGRMRYIYPGANTTFTYANGGTFTVTNYALVKQSFSGVTTGAAFYNKFCTGSASGIITAAEQQVADSEAIAASVLSYPTPVISTGDGVVAGYYLTGAGFENVAVLSLLAFENESPLEFQQVSQSFLKTAKAAGKTKIIVDLQSNGGGYILQGYDMYRQFFPDIVQEDNTRVRESDTMLAITKAFNDFIPADFDPNTATDAEISAYEIYFNYRYDYNITNQPFTSVEDKFAPHVYAGDSFSNLMRWNLNDPLTTSDTYWGIGMDITGYGSRTDFEQPFAAEDIIMLYDGFCASTCVTFSEFMRLQGGVKSIMMGGRPNKDPIQAVGGVKGAQVFGMDTILSIAQFAMQITDDQATYDTISALTETPILRSTATSINLRDTILPEHVNDGLPAQFVREEADCKLFWTLPMIGDVTEVWKAAANAAFNGGSCVAGAGLKKREETGKVVEKRSFEETKKDAFVRQEMFKRMEKETNPIVRAGYGKKVIL